MTEKQIVDEILRYLKDDTYNYAVLIDGEWGCGKTYFAKNTLTDAIENQEEHSGRKRAIKYISLYGCKTISDVQENIAWNFAENAQAKIRDRLHWKDRADTVVGNAVNTSRQIGNIILKKYLPEATVYKIAAEWLDLGTFIFLIDDLERCECPINEVFGFFNELVEHEDTKVIFLANEKEISGVAENNNLELQYLLSLSKEVEWPKVEDSFFYQLKKRNSNLLSFDEMERRRSLLFPQKEANGQYRRVREKLIGESLEYIPDLNSIIPKMIEHTSCSMAAKEILKTELDFFCSSMKSYRHCNLRTFQFFISKVLFLLEELEKVDGIDDELKEKLQLRISSDTFLCAVRYKSNYKPPKASLEWFKDEQEEKSTFIKEYIENGRYDFKTFRDNVFVLQEMFATHLDADDPFNIVYHEYYTKTQGECEEALSRLAQRLSEGRYPTSLYAKIIMGTQRLIDLGFDEVYMDDIKNSMLRNIESKGNVDKIDPELWYLDDKAFKERVSVHINDINAAIISRSNDAKRKSIQELLNEDDWVNKLQTYVNPTNEGFVQDISVFEKAPVEQWINAIHSATPGVINDFRKVLGEVYPRDVHRKSYDIDKTTILDIRKQIDELEETDLIKKASLGWLAYQFDEIIRQHEPLVNNEGQEQ